MGCLQSTPENEPQIPTITAEVKANRCPSFCCNESCDDDKLTCYCCVTLDESKTKH